MVNRWDNIEILRAIDRHQEQSGGAAVWGLSGLSLMEEQAEGLVADESRWRGFVQELHIARDAGLLTFTNESSGGSAPVDPVQDPHYYLQRITNFSLTVAGQDRARGQRVVSPLPDPTEDDGRLISSLICEQIASAIQAEYRTDQIPHFLREAGVPPTTLRLPPDVRADDVQNIFVWLDQVGSEGRRVLRTFVGQWLSGQLITGPDRELRDTLLEQLARQGWYVGDGRLVIGDVTAALPAMSSALREARLAALHPLVKAAAADLYLDGHRASAVFEAVKGVVNRVKAITNSSDDGKTLMGTAFSDRRPQLIVGDLTTETGRNLQEGYRFLFMGAVQAIRNPHAHDPVEDLDEYEALERLGFVSLLMRKLDQVSVSTSGEDSGDRVESQTA